MLLGAFCALCGWLIFACIKADVSLSEGERSEISTWLRAPLTAAPFSAPFRFFVLLFTAVFGRSWIWSRIIAQTIIITGLWLFFLFSLFLFRLPPPYHFFWYRDGAPQLSGYGRDWTTLLGTIVFDNKFDYTIPVVTFVTLGILSIVSSFLTLLPCQAIFLQIRQAGKTRFPVIGLIVSVIAAIINGVLWLYAFYLLAFLYVGKISLRSIMTTGELVLKGFAAAINFPAGLPFQIYVVLVIVAAWWTTVWMVLFVVSMLLAKLSLMPAAHQQSSPRFIKHSRSPFAYTGRITITIFTLFVWFLLARSGSVVEL
jgi:hypothetical protein